MAKERFNPIAELPNLPGAEIANDEEMANIIDSTYPPVGPSNKEAAKRQAEDNPKPTELDEVIADKKENEHLMAVRIFLLIGFILFVFLCIFLTLNYMPKIADNVSNFSKSVTSIFSSKKKAAAPANIPLVATSTLGTVAVTPTATTNTQPATTTLVVVSKPKAPARLLVGILSTYAVGNRTFVRFNVQNIGESASGPWSFSAILPSAETPNYHSQTQASITPKSGIVYTLGFNANQDLPVHITLYTKQGTVNNF